MTASSRRLCTNKEAAISIINNQEGPSFFTVLVGNRTMAAKIWIISGFFGKFVGDDQILFARVPRPRSVSRRQWILIWSLLPLLQLEVTLGRTTRPELFYVNLAQEKWSVLYDTKMSNRDDDVEEDRIDDVKFISYGKHCTYLKATKGQLISKGLFGVTVLSFDQNTNSLFQDFCPSLTKRN